MNGPVHNLLMQLFTLASSKIEDFETYFLDAVITQKDHPRYVKHTLGRIHVFSLYLAIGCMGAGGGGGGPPRGLTHNLFMQVFMHLFSLYSSKIVIFEIAS